MKNKIWKITILTCIFISILLINNSAYALNWIFAPDGTGYFATTSREGNDIFCMEMGGKLKARSLKSGLQEGDKYGDFCSQCPVDAPEIRNTSTTTERDETDEDEEVEEVAYTSEYTSSTSVVDTEHQDVAYILSFGSDKEKNQTAIWQTDLNKTGIKTEDQIQSKHPTQFVTADGLADEAKEYREYYESIKTGFQKQDLTDYASVKTCVDQDNDTYTVGKFKIKYSEHSNEAIEGENIVHWEDTSDTVKKFGYIKDIKLKDQNGNQLTILDILASDGSSIKSRANYSYPHSEEEFYVKFKYDGTGTANKVYLDIEFKYLYQCHATLASLSGKIYEWKWVKKDHSDTSHDHSCAKASADTKHHHGCKYTTHTHDSDCGYTTHSHVTACGSSPSYSSCTGTLNSNYYCDNEMNSGWTCYTYKDKEWVLEKAEYRDAQTLLEVEKYEGATYWGYPEWKTDTLTTSGNPIDITMDIEGIVFLDLAAGKSTVNASDYNGKYDSSIDKLMANIEVTLYEEGTNAIAAVLSGTNGTLTDSNGHFAFKRLNAQKKYYITYKFNGQKYENSTYKVAIADYNTNSWAVTSKASILDTDRTNYNKKFEVINSSPGNYTNINNVTGFNLTSNKTYKIFEQTDSVGTAEYNDMVRLQNAIYEQIKSFISSNGRYPNSDSDKRTIYQNVANNNSSISEVKNKIQYIVDMEVIAKTGYKSSMQYYPVYNKFVIDTSSRTIGGTTYNAIYDGQRHINLGLMEREKLDLTIYKDLEELTIYINNKRFVYEYKSREGEMNVTLVESDVHNNYNVHEKNTSGRGTDIYDRVNNTNVYERNIRESDISYISYLASDQTRDYSKRLRIFATYRIRVKNFSDGQITANITELRDHFDNDYVFNNEVNSSVITYNVLSRPSVVETSENKYEFVKTAGDYLSWSNTTEGDPTNTITTTDEKMKNISIKTAEYFDVYNMFEVKTEAIQDLLNTGSSTKENYAQIAGYKSYYTNQRKYSNGDTINNAGYVAGLVDRDSRPGDFNANSTSVQKFVSYTYTDEFKNKSGEQRTKESREVFEDDADKAPGINLKVLREYRVLKGNVWEDKILEDKLKDYNIRQGNGENDDSQAIEDLRVQLIDMDIIGEITPYSTYNTVTDIYHMGDTMTNGVFLEATTLTDASGNYEFDGYIPGNYLLRFIYGEQELLVTSGNSGKVYEGQDYKSTLYTESDHQYVDANNNPIYWYETTKTQKKSDAQDNLVRRNEINTTNKTMNFHVASVLNYYENNDASYTQELENRSKLFADTEKLVLEVEYVQTEADYSKDDENKVYIVENVDFGLVERPRQELTITKDIANIRIIANSGQTVFDAEQKVSNLAWLTPIKNINKPTEDRNGMIQATLDSNLMHGATVKILYRISIENTGEKDYVLSDGTVDKNFYNTGVELSTSNLVTTKADCVLDYIENNLKFSNELDDIDKDKKYNQYWELVIGEDNKGTTTNKLDTVLTTDTDSLIDPSLKPTVREYNAIIKTTDDSPLLYNLIPAERRGERYDTLATSTNPTTKTETTLLLTKVLDTSDNSTDNFIYDNGLEIVQTSNQTGRRHYNNKDKSKYNEDDQITKTEIISSIPGNYVPTNASDSTRDQSVVTPEPDCDYAERVTVLPPFGQRNKTIIIISSILAVIILGVGIVIIKKKVLKK